MIPNKGNNGVGFCPRFKLIVWQQSAPDVVLMSRIRCKSWSCSHCAKKNRELWSSFLKMKLQRVSSNWWFVTITAHERDRSAAGSLENLRKGLDRLMKRVNRVWEGVQYVRVYEKHKKGAYHAHLVVSELSPRITRRQNKNKTISFSPADKTEQGRTWGVQTYFRRAARDCKMGYMVKVIRLDDERQAVSYVVKYMTKSAQSFYARGLRRIQTSSRIGSPVKKRTRGDWTAAKYVWQSDMPPGADLIDLNTKEVIKPEYWKENVAYPL